MRSLQCRAHKAHAISQHHIHSFEGEVQKIVFFFFAFTSSEIIDLRMTEKPKGILFVSSQTNGTQNRCSATTTTNEYNFYSLHSSFVACDTVTSVFSE